MEADEHSGSINLFSFDGNKCGLWVYHQDHTSFNAEFW